MSRVEKIIHKGKEVVYLDFSGLDIQRRDEIKATIENGKKVIETYSHASALTLVNFSDTRYSSEVVADFRGFTEHNKSYVKKGAVIGIHGMTKIVFDGVMRLTGRNLPIFASKEEAMDWLVSDSD